MNHAAALSRLSLSLSRLSRLSLSLSLSLSIHVCISVNLAFPLTLSSSRPLCSPLISLFSLSCITSFPPQPQLRGFFCTCLCPLLLTSLLLLKFFSLFAVGPFFSDHGLTSFCCSRPACMTLLIVHAVLPVSRVCFGKRLLLVIARVPCAPRRHKRSAYHCLGGNALSKCRLCLSVCRGQLSCDDVETLNERTHAMFEVGARLPMLGLALVRWTS